MGEERAATAVEGEDSEVVGEVLGGTGGKVEGMEMEEAQGD